MSTDHTIEEPITVEWARRFIAACSFEFDDRKSIADGGNASRRVHFRTGWADAGRKTYATGTLRHLTWQNLGYRCGQHFGDGVDPDEVLDVLLAAYSDSSGARERMPKTSRRGEWSYAEAVAALYTYLDVRGGSVSRKVNSPAWRLSKLIGRSLAAATSRMGDLKKVDPFDDSETQFHATSQLVALWERFTDEATGDLDEATVRSEFARLWKDAPSPSAEPVEATKSPAIALRSYQRANETVEPAPRSPAQYDPDVVGRGYRSHNRLQNALHDHLTEASLTPKTPEADEMQFDLGWWNGSTFFVAEVKSLTDANEEKQLRLGLGQVLRYRHALATRIEEAVVAVLAVEHSPSDERWHDLCRELGVRLVWPGQWGGLRQTG